MLKEIDENTYKFKNLLIDKEALEVLHNVVENTITKSQINKLYTIIVKD